MKFGIRKPSIKKSISARTTGKAKRKFKKLVNPLYGKKGMGWIKNPKRALKNKVYRKTTVSTKAVGGCLWACIYYPCYWIILLCWWCCILMWWMVKCVFLAMWWMLVTIINGIISLVGLILGCEVLEPNTVLKPDEEINE